jgi:hypothetical protein
MPTRLWTRLIFFIGTLLVGPAILDAQGMTTIEIQNVQLAKSVAGVVRDPLGSPMSGVLVEEFSAEWKESLRSTKTNAEGRFAFAPIKRRKIYYLQLRMDGFNPLRVRVKVDPNRGKELQLEMSVAN